MGRRDNSGSRGTGRREATMLTYKANAVRQFMKRLQEISEAWETKEDGQPDLWYRGLQKSSWLLVPKLYRPSEPAKKLLQTEDEIREEFARRAPSLTQYRPENAWEWYFLMQHYGAPTRLLDWTEDPLIGLYFAVKDTEELQDGELEQFRLCFGSIGWCKNTGTEWMPATCVHEAQGGQTVKPSVCHALNQPSPICLDRK